MSGGDDHDPPDRREPDQKALRELHLAEFSALRAEIGARSGVQHQLMALNITALAAIGGFVISDKADPLLLLMLPLVSCALGVIWHDIRIFHAGTPSSAATRLVINELQVGGCLSWQALWLRTAA